MKSVLFVSCIVLALALVQGKKLIDVHNKCQSVKATHVDEEVFRKLRENIQVTLPANYEDHMLCMSKEAGFQKADGSLNVAEIRKKIEEVEKDKAKVDKFVADCAVVKPTPGKTASELFKCLHVKAGITVLKN